MLLFNPWIERFSDYLWKEKVVYGIKGNTPFINGHYLREMQRRDNVEMIWQNNSIS